MIKYNIHHVGGLYFEIVDDDGKNRTYEVLFQDNKSNSIIYKTEMKPKTWARLQRKYLSDLSVIVRYEGRTIIQVNLLDEIRGKKVFISFESKALGDTLAWIPYCLEFARHYDCQVVVSTFKNFLFEKSYPELTFVGRGVRVDSIFAMFEIGWYWDKQKEPSHPALYPLQQTASNILLLPHKEIRPEIDFTPPETPAIDGKYVCISTRSTSGCKHWDYWQDVIDFLVGEGYKVLEISNEETDYKNLTPFPDKSLENTMATIHHSAFFMGLSSGLSWLAWALSKKVYMISNFTQKDHEFTSNTVRFYDESICHGCWNNPLFKFNKGDWNWCPEHEDTPRKFECHKLISSEKVITTIKNEGF